MVRALLHVGIKAGLKIDDFAPRLSFFWGIGMNFYMASVCLLSVTGSSAELEVAGVCDLAEMARNRCILNMFHKYLTMSAWKGFFFVKIEG